MPAVENFRNALKELQIDTEIVTQIMAGYEKITDKASKPRRAAFFIQTIQRMEQLTDTETCHAIRDACACSKGGWRLAAVQKIARK